MMKNRIKRRRGGGDDDNNNGDDDSDDDDDDGTSYDIPSLTVNKKLSNRVHYKSYNNFSSANKIGSATIYIVNEGDKKTVVPVFFRTL